MTHKEFKEKALEKPGVKEVYDKLVAEFKEIEHEIRIKKDLSYQKYYVTLGMQTYGGSFVYNLGEALAHADPSNTRKIAHAFPDYWKEYLKLGMEIEKDSEKNGCHEYIRKRIENRKTSELSFGNV